MTLRPPWILLGECQPGEVFETRDTKLRAVVVAINAASVSVRLVGSRRAVRWAQRTEGRVLSPEETERSVTVTKKERKGIKGARLTIQSGVRILKRMETGQADEASIAKAESLIREGLRTLREEGPEKPEKPANGEKKANGNGAKKAAKKAPKKKAASKKSAGEVLDSVMPRKKKK